MAQLWTSLTRWDFTLFLTVIVGWFFSPSTIEWKECCNNVSLFAISKRGENQLKKSQGEGKK